jgi:Holliday junction DNA helicase RuvA
MVSRGELPQESAPADVVSQTYELLLRLGHSESDARRLLDRALQSGKKYQDVQELIQAIYQQTRPR